MNKVKSIFLHGDVCEILQQDRFSSLAYCLGLKTSMAIIVELARSYRCEFAVVTVEIYSCPHCGTRVNITAGAENFRSVPLYFLGEFLNGRFKPFIIRFSWVRMLSSSIPLKNPASLTP